MPNYKGQKRVFVLVGVPACGKSTYAEYFKKPKMDDVTEVISSDEVRKEVYGNPEIQGDPKHIFAMVETKMIKALQNGKDVVIDATSINVAERANYIQISKEFDAYPIAVVFDTPIDVCKKRNKLRDRTVPDSVYDKMLAKYQEPTIEEGFQEIQHVGGIEFKEHQYPIRKEIKFFEFNQEIGQCQINVDAGVLEDFVIYDDWQNEGLGSEILKELIDKYNIKSLEVVGTNERAIHLYEKFGFKQKKIVLIEMEREENV